MFHMGNASYMKCLNSTQEFHIWNISYIKLLREIFVRDGQIFRS